MMYSMPITATFWQAIPGHPLCGTVRNSCIFGAKVRSNKPAGIENKERFAAFSQVGLLPEAGDLAGVQEDTPGEGPGG